MAYSITLFNASTTQVWRVIRGDIESDASFVGLVVAYVDDLLLCMPSAGLRTSFNQALRNLWTLSSEQVLDGSSQFMFLGIEIQRTASGDLLVHQASFVRSLLSSYGLEGSTKPIHAVTIALPTVDDVPPDAILLKTLQNMPVNSTGWPHARGQTWHILLP